MDISQSVHAILSRQDVVTDLFYVKYLDRYPDVRDFFTDVDMTQQAVLLKMALTVMAQYYVHRYPAAEHYLSVVGQKHDVRNIPPDLYADWRDCLLDTLEQFHGSDWNEPLESEWTEAVNLATDVILRSYAPSTTD